MKTPFTRWLGLVLAAASRERGARAAFLEFLDQESIVLQPGPIWGRAAWAVKQSGCRST